MHHGDSSKMKIVAISWLVNDAHYGDSLGNSSFSLSREKKNWLFWSIALMSFDLERQLLIERFY